MVNTRGYRGRHRGGHILTLDSMLDDLYRRIAYVNNKAYRYRYGYRAAYIRWPAIATHKLTTATLKMLASYLTKK